MEVAMEPVTFGGTDASTKISDVQSKELALIRLVQSERPYFLRMALSIVRSEEDAEDVLQGAFLSAWVGVGTFHGESTMRTWMTSIVRNRALTLLRSRRSGRMVSLEADSSCLTAFEMSNSHVVKSPEKEAAKGEALRVVSEEMQRIPERMRRVLELYYLQEQSMQEMSAHMRKSVPSVKSTLMRARTLLQNRVRKSTGRLHNGRSMAAGK